MEELKIEVPRGCGEVWRMYWEMRTGEVLTYQEMKAYADFMGIVFSPWEIETFRMMDTAVNRELSKAMKGN